MKSKFQFLLFSLLLSNIELVMENSAQIAKSLVWYKFKGVYKNLQEYIARVGISSKLKGRYFYNC